VLDHKFAESFIGLSWEAFLNWARRLWLHIHIRAARENDEEADDLQKVLDIVERIKQELIKAIALEQVVRPAASDTRLIECFNVGHAGNAFEIVRHSLLFDQIMTLMRIWDTTANVHSIKELVRLLGNRNLVDKLVERERGAYCDITVGNTEFGERRQQLPFPADRATPGIREQQLRARLQSWLANVNKVRGYAETTRLRGCRNKILAHATAWPSLRPTRLPNYGDEQKLLDLTIPVVSEGYRLVTGIHYDFSAAKSVWGLAQRDMWEIARSGTRGERYSPSSRNMADLARELKGAGSITIRG